MKKKLINMSKNLKSALKISILPISALLDDGLSELKKGWKNYPKIFLKPKTLKFCACFTQTLVQIKKME